MATRGRPKLPLAQRKSYSKQIVETICTKLSQGVPLREICRAEGMPAWPTVYAWAKEDEDFGKAIASARAIGFDAIAEECLAIADDTANDTTFGPNGEMANTEWIARSKLRVETRLKLLSKWDPKRYGDKLDVTVEDVTDRAAIMRQAREKRLTDGQSEG
jgi:hypothetical protein